ncbi:LAMI_0C00892g1_1 [Lachancea mirantina]|uniref:LAMI_0C00892g1_1 n=1 Tax=Lachancea mirantina TaxID=1230905 RepID=A0A1G4IZR8_9SACH|nr:LAMI_0C00892g1_1 [Lachancea mirantina]
MPSVELSTSQIRRVLKNDLERPVSITTPFGNMLLEIQGDLDFPAESPRYDPQRIFSKYQDDQIVRFGRLIIEADYKKATLYIGEKQRLLGSIMKLETPLGLLKFNQDSTTVELEDIIQFKIIFKDRPLPIM